MVHAWKSARIIGAIAIELFIYVSEQETMVSEIAQTDNFNDKTNIKVVGVGGAGGNAVNRMIAVFKASNLLRSTLMQRICCDPTPMSRSR